MVLRNASVFKFKIISDHWYHSPSLLGSTFETGFTLGLDICQLGATIHIDIDIDILISIFHQYIDIDYIVRLVLY